MTYGWIDETLAPEGTHTWNVTVAPAGVAGDATDTVCVNAEDDARCTESEAFPANAFPVDREALPLVAAQPWIPDSKLYSAVSPDEPEVEPELEPDVPVLDPEEPLLEPDAAALEPDVPDPDVPDPDAPVAPTLPLSGRPPAV